MVFKYFSTTCFDSDEFASSETGFVEVNSIQSAVIESTEPDIALWRCKDGSIPSECGWKCTIVLQRGIG